LVTVIVTLWSGLIDRQSCFFVTTSIKRRIPYNRSVSSIDQALLSSHFWRHALDRGHERQAEPHTRPALRLGYSTRGRVEADAMLQVRQKELGVSAAKAARLRRA
jgi:hypothetical protein